MTRYETRQGEGLAFRLQLYWNSRAYKVTKVDDQDREQPGHLENVKAHALPCLAAHRTPAALRGTSVVSHGDSVLWEAGAALTRRGQTHRQ